MSRAVIAGVGMAVAMMALAGPAVEIRRMEEPRPVRLSPRRGRPWKSGNNRSYATGKYKGSARAKRATARGGNPARY